MKAKNKKDPKGTIFIVDDDAEHLRPMGSLLLENGCRLKQMAMTDFSTGLRKEIHKRKRAEEAMRQLEKKCSILNARLQKDRQDQKRRRAEREVLQAREEWEQTFDAVPDMIAILDKEYRILRVNKAMADRCGGEKRAIEGQKCYEYVHGLDQPPEFCPHAKLMKDGREHVAEIFEQRLNSWFHVSASPLYDEQGKLIASVHVARDITEKKLARDEKTEAEKQLYQAQKMEAIGNLAGGIAHDFNNLLGVIIGCTELIQLEMETENSAYHFLVQILNAGHRAKDLVRQILTFCRKKEQDYQIVKVDLIVKETLKLLRASLPSTIEIKQNIKNGSGTVLADPTRIHQILMNLCTNAAHALRENGGILEVGLADVDIGYKEANQMPGLNCGPHIKLIVRDTGCGMDPAMRERIFEPYFTTKGSTGGTGLGLAMVHGIVTGYGGAVKADSVKGKGSIFQVYLPRNDHLQGIPESVPSKVLPRGSERILLVDDEVALVNTSEMMLRSLGYEVVTTTDAIEAMDVFRTHPQRFDIVITDQTMPKKTGAALSKELMVVRPDIPIILCTGYSDTITSEEAATMGIKEFLMKPLNRRQLAESIHKVLHENA